MAEKELPEIELSYLLKDEDREAGPTFLLAGRQYAGTRTDEEEAFVQVRERGMIAFVVYGRKVLEALSYAEIGHEADLMQEEIEERITQLGSGELLPRTRAGQQMSGRLPEPE
jgi:hypothetical protein